MILDKDNDAVVFKSDDAYYAAVKQGGKTAEVRMMSRQEADALWEFNPSHITLTDLYGHHAMTFPITYRAPVAKLLGTELWLFCFTKE